MDKTLTSPLLPNPSISPVKEILMEETPTYKDIIAEKLSSQFTSLGPSEHDMKEGSNLDNRGILL